MRATGAEGRGARGDGARLGFGGAGDEGADAVDIELAEAEGRRLARDGETQCADFGKEDIIELLDDDGSV